MAQQQWSVHNSGGDPGDATDEDEEYDIPPLSQGSTISSSSIATPGERKRRMEFDDEPPEEQGDTSRERINALGVGERTIAVHKRKKVVVKVGGVIDIGQENADVGFDFGEADFLDYKLIEDSDMGGV